MKSNFDRLDNKDNNQNLGPEELKAWKDAAKGANPKTFKDMAAAAEIPEDQVEMLREAFQDDELLDELDYAQDDGVGPDGNISKADIDAWQKYDTWKSENIPSHESYDTLGRERMTAAELAGSLDGPQPTSVSPAEEAPAPEAAPAPEEAPAVGVDAVPAQTIPGDESDRDR